MFADWEEDDDNAADEKSSAASAEVAGRTPSAAVPSGQDAANVFVQVNFCLCLFCLLLPFASFAFCLLLPLLPFAS